MSLYKVSLQGQSPLLMNRFTEEAAAKVSAGTSVAMTTGSRGLPREQAEPRLYLSANGAPMIPGPNVFAGLVSAGKFIKAGRRQLTTGTSSLIPAGMQIVETECRIENPFGGKVGWEVDSRSVVIPATRGRVMCHRPRFDAWKISFSIETDDTMFDEKITRALVENLCTKIGLGDFRPDRKGPFGRSMIVDWCKEKNVA